jgi:hypothetical protein
MIFEGNYYWRAGPCFRQDAFAYRKTLPKDYLAAFGLEVPMHVSLVRPEER